MRIIGAIAAYIISRQPEYYETRYCYVLDNIFFGNQTRVEELYPDCANLYSGRNPKQQVLVLADVLGARRDHISAGFTFAFAGSVWLSLVIHAAGAEFYVSPRSLGPSGEGSSDEARKSRMLTITWNEQLRLTPAESQRLRKVSFQRQLEAGMENPGNAGTTAQRLGDAEPRTSPSTGGDSASSTWTMPDSTAGKEMTARSD
jgi:hypothetical protein